VRDLGSGVLNRFLTAPVCRTPDVLFVPSLVRLATEHVSLRSLIGTEFPKVVYVFCFTKWDTKERRYVAPSFKATRSYIKRHNGKPVTDTKEDLDPSEVDVYGRARLGSRHVRRDET
jgi:hypothetical protein